jgi:hypothetical protein
MNALSEIKSEPSREMVFKPTHSGSGVYGIPPHTQVPTKKL